MNKKLLSCLVALFFVSIQGNSQETRATELCVPENEWTSYACISRVEMNGMINETDPGIPNETPFEEDFRDDPTKLIKLTRGEKYDLKVQFSNFNSGTLDFYYLRAYFDWNNDLEYSEAETYVQEVQAGRQGGFIDKVFEITVPIDAVLGKINMRVFTSFISDNPAYQGTGPCDLVESGQYEEYMVEISGVDRVITNSSESVSVYPNPATECLYISGDISVESYQLYTIDGKTIQRGEVVNNRIDVSACQSGMYILKMHTGEGTKVLNVIIR